MSETMMSSENEKQNGQAQGASTEETSQASAHQEARLERVRQYQREALGRPDSLAASMALINGGMMQCTMELEQKLLQSLSRPEMTAEQLHKQQPALDFYSKLTRQIDRFAQFELRSREAQAKLGQQKVEAAESRLPKSR